MQPRYRRLPASMAWPGTRATGASSATRARSTVAARAPRMQRAGWAALEARTRRSFVTASSAGSRFSSPFAIFSA